VSNLQNQLQKQLMQQQRLLLFAHDVMMGKPAN